MSSSTPIVSHVMMSAAPARMEGWFVWRDDVPERESVTDGVSPQQERELIHEENAATAAPPRFILCSWDLEAATAAESGAQPAESVRRATPHPNFRIEATSLIQLLISYFFLYGDGRCPAHGAGKTWANDSLFRSRAKGCRLGGRLKVRGFNFVRLEALSTGFLTEPPIPRLT